ncbi:uncharacterized protein LOC129727511 isoform X2 [Wyeomyia smithii]|uniref:uncharacterized protein LOC129727511 isoform X2 n=1 Tax=Wyeomyia smithii TaxID=174621 RepID=UPI00246811EE|nr:uncharacterized protein LOC129727511 isoform X2 [Wyeomyia smithii]
MSHLKLALLPLGLLSWFLVDLAQAKHVIDVNAYFEDCENGLPLPAVNIDELESLEDEEGNSMLNGNMVFNENYSAPVELKISTERMKQGSWTNGEVNRNIDDICSLLKENIEPWYVMTKLMSDCPFEAGQVESFDHAVLGDLGLDIPAPFAGDWRLYAEVTSVRNERKVTECVRISFAIKEI